MSLVRAVNVSRVHVMGGQPLTVLDRLNLTVDHEEFLAIMGASGSGKTTLLSLLSGLESPTSGQIFLDGKEITRLDEDAMAPIRNRMFGFVFQSFHLVPSLTALENVMFPAELQGAPDAAERAMDLIASVNMAGRRDHFPHQLSGGERQRIAICRALINQPAVVFADEPTGNLDAENSDAILNLMLDLHRECRTTLILVTHNPVIARKADRVLTLHRGRLHDESASVA